MSKCIYAFTVMMSTTKSQGEFRMHRSHTTLPVLGASLFFLFALSAARAQAQLNCQICSAQCDLSGCSLPTCGSASVGGCDCEVKTRFLRDRAVVTCLTSGACNSLDGSLCPGEDDRPPRVGPESSRFIFSLGQYRELYHRIRRVDPDIAAALTSIDLHAETWTSGTYTGTVQIGPRPTLGGKERYEIPKAFRVEVTVEDGEANVRVEVETPSGTVVAEGTLRERGASGRIVIERAEASGSLEHIDW